MIRTVVCKKEGCSGNKFHIETIDNNIQATCKECGNKYIYEIGSDGYELLSTCASCKNDTFKLFRDINANKLYCKCSECGDPPERIFIDADGIQIPYDTKLLQEIKNHMNSIEQKLLNLDIRLENLERGQNILEESLAYINKYIVENK